MEALKQSLTQWRDTVATSTLQLCLPAEVQDVKLP